MCHASAPFRPVNAEVWSISTSRRCQPDVDWSDTEPGKDAVRLPSSPIDKALCELVPRDAYMMVYDSA